MGATGPCPRSADAYIRQDIATAKPATGCRHPRSNCRPDVAGSVRIRSPSHSRIEIAVGLELAIMAGQLNGATESDDRLEHPTARTRLSGVWQGLCRQAGLP